MDSGFRLSRSRLSDELIGSQVRLVHRKNLLVGVDGAEALQPVLQLLVAGPRGGKALDAEQASSFVEGGRHVGVEVCVDPSGDAAG